MGIFKGCGNCDLLVVWLFLALFVESFILILVNFLLPLKTRFNAEPKPGFRMQCNNSGPGVYVSILCIDPKDNLLVRMSGGRLMPQTPNV